MYFLAGGWLANPAGLSRQTKEKFTSLINPLHWDPLLLRFAMQFCNKINELIMCTTYLPTYMAHSNVLGFYKLNFYCSQRLSRILVGYWACHVTYEMKKVLHKFGIGRLLNQFRIRLFCLVKQYQIRGGNFKLIGHVTSSVICKDFSMQC